MVHFPSHPTYKWKYSIEITNQIYRPVGVKQCLVKENGQGPNAATEMLSSQQIAKLLN